MAWAEVEFIHLENGLKVVLDQRKHIPQISMEARYDIQPTKLEGLPHLVEHLLHIT